MKSNPAEADWRMTILEYWEGGERVWVLAVVPGFGMVISSELAEIRR